MLHPRFLPKKEKLVLVILKIQLVSLFACVFFSLPLSSAGLDAFIENVKNNQVTSVTLQNVVISEGDIDEIVNAFTHRGRYFAGDSAAKSLKSVDLRFVVNHNAEENYCFELTVELSYQLSQPHELLDQDVIPSNYLRGSSIFFDKNFKDFRFKYGDDEFSSLQNFWENWVGASSGVSFMYK
jgi:hypothetical protein